MNDITVERCPGGVKVTIFVGAKKASISITHKKARQIAAALMMGAMEARESEQRDDLADRVLSILKGKKS